jgi:hypothetical protein
MFGLGSIIYTTSADCSATFTIRTYCSELQQKLIERTWKLTNGISMSFLQQFSEKQLQAYLDRLEAVK